MNKKISFLGLFLWLWQVNAQTEIKLMTYNLLHFPTGTSYDRTADLRYILDTYQPDIFMVAELESENGSDMILDNCLNYNDNKYNAASFIENNSSYYRDLQQMLYYNNQMFELTYETILLTSVRDINHYTLQLITEDVTKQPVYIDIYVAHLKASNGSDDIQTRAEMVEVFTNDLQNIPDNHYVIFAGDFNLYTASEPAYQEIVDNTNAIVMVDPSGSAGNWHNNYSYRHLHTQATHSQSNGVFVGGGIDDRFDFIILSENLFNNPELEYVENTYKSFGNNGNCFNKAINNSDCDSEEYDFTLRTHLYNMSDHLPVTASLQTDQSLAVTTEVPSLKNFYIPENPVHNYLTLNGNTQADMQLQVYNTWGQKIMEIPHYQINTNINVSHLNTGVYVLFIKTDNYSQTIKFVKAD